MSSAGRLPFQAALNGAVDEAEMEALRHQVNSYSEVAWFLRQDARQRVMCGSCRSSSSVAAALEESASEAGGRGDACAAGEQARVAERQGFSSPAEEAPPEGEGEPPDDFLCPITTEIMSDPVMAADGHLTGTPTSGRRSSAGSRPSRRAL